MPEFGDVLAFGVLVVLPMSMPTQNANANSSESNL